MGKRTMAESKLKDITEMTDKEFAELTRNQGPVVFQIIKPSRVTKKEVKAYSHLIKHAPANSVAYDIGDILHVRSTPGFESINKHYSIAVQYYKKK